jgi:1-acyl-sn-glycerol-3-phosphate acyltransferase
VVFLAIEDHPAYVIKRELLRLPIYGWYCAKIGMIGVDRSAGARALITMARAAKPVAAEGRAVVIFPEGTRTAPGAPPAYQPGVYALYRDLGVPVVPVAIDSGRFWGRRTFMKHPGVITVEYLPPIPAGLDRASFMTALQTAIETAMARLESVDRPA